MTEIWHNPRCSKSRQTLALLEERGIAPTIRLYQQDAPTETEIRAALAALNIPAIALMRSGDALFKELGLTKDMEDDRLITAMAAHPALIERPVVLHEGRAALGRPPESVLDLF
ncbi:arsenate reductase (glutaredoxin) [Defluviimonas aestuarii]|uniref:arsenate reductase (glutaredoxin) n=1 Tax=Albidovulum aestuarii TaxID=1130726 RepID=UPI00249A99AB|nr:arsenate reductase (glutaredoxin) [Defluviimonas aestuarii]MDI3336156.1 arsenate reductase (glutaredoxin) [Defluviimonas aestuarii]